MTDPRGFSYTEAWRHQCEVRFVLALPRAERAAYVDSTAKYRTPDAVERLRHDVVDAYRCARDGLPWPQLPDEECHTRKAHAVHLAVNGSGQGGQAYPLPAHGSFLAPADAGNSDPVRRVVSGVAA